ncbi:trypsin-like peptidase domain-containing protein [Moorena sp. SIO3B2]|uniref:trypsin-like serine protease n=1 Tax=Moorena sp. SIO3B2 TaxID=2607827 RepID=UPI0013CCEC9A|nr:trypsin-like peptidase domain-containing protein [Moorena sp. SIO3B2]NEP37595.1 trypsin-like peptidase domain-containing protein [Moorena sp. SIO3B2]
MNHTHKLSLLVLGITTTLGLLITPHAKTLSINQYSEDDINAISRMTTVVIGNYSGTFEEEDSYGNVNCTEPKIIKNIDKKKKQIKENQASGVIIAKRNNTFYVLTNQHVLEKGADCYGIVVWDGDKHSIHFSKDSDIQYIDKKEFGQGVDLALIKFQGYSSNQYYVASLKDSNTIPDSGQLFVSGWPTPPEDVVSRC